MQILIAGLGYTGKKLASLYLQEKHAVIGLKRSSSSSHESKGIKLVQQDVTQNLNKLQSEAKFDICYYLVSSSAPNKESYEKAYVDGLKKLIEFLEKHSPQCHLIFTSSTGVYHQTKAEWVDEKSSTEPDSFRGSVLLKAEKICYDCKLNSTVVRSSGIYGPGRTGVFKPC